jgi:hypothetical protein
MNSSALKTVVSGNLKSALHLTCKTLKLGL